MARAEIVQIHAREVFDSRGRPTVEAVVTCEGGRPCRAIAPAGASTGRAEARELRDGGERLGGWGVRRAVENVLREIAPAVIGRDAADQAAIDAKLIALDASANKERLGANALLAVSLASAYAAADALGQSAVEHLHYLWRQVRNPVHESAALDTVGHGPSLPLPMVNMISGGKHAGGQLDFQDYLLMPVGAASYSQALEWIVAAYQQLGRHLTEAGHEGVLVGDEGGYGPKLRSNEEALDVLMRVIERTGLRPGRDLAIALDVAASHFHDAGKYRLSATGGRELTGPELAEHLTGLVRQYPIVSIEDGLAEDDWDGWTELTKQLEDRVQLIGDDLFATNPERLRHGIERGVANAVLIKLNQIGTLSETLQTLKLAVDHGYRPIISARSGETEDVTIADLVVATGAGQIKVGSVARSERLAKYNQLLRWEDECAGRWPYVGKGPVATWLSAE
ncbi:MAG: phosphopyruvate hydratase [Planctomycetaceae bacterium]|nr:phosphopyruvate hydratase [Planctomycetaceae bacterium]